MFYCVQDAVTFLFILPSIMTGDKCELVLHQSITLCFGGSLLPGNKIRSGRPP